MLTSEFHQLLSFMFRERPCLRLEEDTQLKVWPPFVHIKAESESTSLMDEDAGELDARGQIYQASKFWGVKVHHVTTVISTVLLAQNLLIDSTLCVLSTEIHYSVK